MSSPVEVYTTFLSLVRNVVYTGRISHGALRNSFMVLALMVATISIKGVPCRMVYALFSFSSCFFDQKHHLASHLIHRAWWRGSDLFPGVPARKKVAKRRKCIFERLHEREKDDKQCYHKKCGRSHRYYSFSILMLRQ